MGVAGERVPLLAPWLQGLPHPHPLCPIVVGLGGNPEPQLCTWALYLGDVDQVSQKKEAKGGQGAN